MLRGISLREYLSTARWFGGEGTAIASIRVADVVPLWHQPWTFALRVVVELVQQADASAYQLLVSVRCPESALAASVVMIARAHDRSSREWIVVDGFTDREVRTRLWQAFLESEHFEFGHTCWRIRGHAAAGPRETSSRQLASEQSNSSIIYGEQVIMKLYRRLQHGINPDAEMTRFLCRHDFAHTPEILGEIEFVHGDGNSTAAIVCRYIAESTDLWSWLMALARSSNEHTFEMAFVDIAGRVGELTRCLHDALACDPDDPAFRSVPASDEDVFTWRDAALTNIRAATERIAISSIVVHDDNNARAVSSAIEHWQNMVIGATELARHDAGIRIRHHGDYHLGQVLRTHTGGLMVIDFEGEPTRPLWLRRTKHNPLRDVAGMLRSLSYASATVAVQLTKRGGAEHVWTLQMSWYNAVHDAFLCGYRLTEGASWLPSDREATRSLLAIFEAEKLFYELVYELDHRPTWVWIPLSVLVGPEVASNAMLGI